MHSLRFHTENCLLAHLSGVFNVFADQAAEGPMLLLDAILVVYHRHGRCLFERSPVHAVS